MMSESHRDRDRERPECANGHESEFDSVPRRDGRGPDSPAATVNSESVASAAAA